jgi:hypothetical protein
VKSSDLPGITEGRSCKSKVFRSTRHHRMEELLQLQRSAWYWLNEFSFCACAPGPRDSGFAGISQSFSKVHLFEHSTILSHILWFVGQIGTPISHNKYLINLKQNGSHHHYLLQFLVD